MSNNCSFARNNDQLFVVTSTYMTGRTYNILIVYTRILTKYRDSQDTQFFFFFFLFAKDIYKEHYTRGANEWDKI